MPGDTKQLWRSLFQENRSLQSRRAWYGGALMLAALEALASLARSYVFTSTPFFDTPLLWISLSLLKGLFFGPLLGFTTLRAYQFWQLKRWDDACLICLRGGFALCLTQGLFALLCFLSHSAFPLLTWLAASWPHFALWLTLNVALIWALLLLVAGFLLPSDAQKTIQISEKVRF